MADYITKAQYDELAESVLSSLVSYARGLGLIREG